jgi:hypothetical protein
VTALDAADGGPFPIAFVAVTVNVYAVPFVRPVTTTLVAGGLPPTVVTGCAVAPMYGVTVYEVSALPPFDTGAVHDTVACPAPAVAVTFVGAPGTAAGVTAFDCAEGALFPTPFVAVTVNVYAVPLVSPVTVVEVAGGLPVTVVVGCAVAPMYGVTVYDVSALPPFDTGADHDTVAWPFPGVAVAFDGAPGTLAGVTAFDAADCDPVPIAFVAATLKVYDVPFVSPATVVVVAGGLPVTVVTGCAVVPMYGVTVYDVIALPPFDAGAVHDTVAWPEPPVAVTFVGAPGAAPGVTGLDAAEAGLVPTEFVAFTVKVYAVPFVSPVTVAVAAGGLPVTVVAGCAVVPMYGVTV